jgi:hypothetical protein
MDLVSYVPGVLNTKNFTPGNGTPAPFNVTHQGLTDGTGPLDASKLMAEFINRLNLQVASAIIAAGQTYDPTNWAQLGGVIGSLESSITLISSQLAGGITLGSTHVLLGGATLSIDGLTEVTATAFHGTADNSLALGGYPASFYARYANPGNWSAPQRAFYTNVDNASAGSTFIYDGAAKGQICRISLSGTGTVTFGAPVNCVEGSMYKFVLSPADSNAKTYAWNSAYKFPGGVPVLTAATTYPHVDTITFLGGPNSTLIYDGSSADVY